jgi:hypothetical protein
MISIPETGAEPWEVVGVARDSKYAAVFEPRLSYVYRPQLQDSSRLRTINIRSTRRSARFKRPRPACSD